jgi:mRNA-degrading endonuclease toxin of MazEF toxin-antitoxin module
LSFQKNSYNRKYADVIVCAVTSNLEESEYGHTITTASLEEGHLKLTSKIRVDAIANIEQAIIIKKIGCLKSVLFNKVLKMIDTLFIDRK